MFELEDFDLDDEVFLNTQMPTERKNSPIKSSDTKSFPFEDNNDTFLNISNSINELDYFHSQNNQLENKLLLKENQNKSFLHIDEHKSKIHTVNANQSKNFTLNFDDGFDSDDEAFFNTPDILHDSTNLLNSKVSISNIHLNKDYESNNSANSENQKLMFKLTNNYLKSNHDSYLNTTVTSVTTTPKCTSRKFPGPAGLLLEHDDVHSENSTNLELLDTSVNISENDSEEEKLCTQANDSSFSSLSYQQFLSDFINTDIDILLDKFNVAWIKQKLLPYTASGQFFTEKIPFFVSIIKEIDCLSPDPAVLLADKTGNIRGTIHRAVWNQFSSQLKLGSVLILSKVGVSCQKIVNGFTLNITSDHLIAIYSFSTENPQEVIVTRTTDLTNAEIVNNAKRWNIFNTDTLNKNPHSEIRNQINVFDNLKLSNTFLVENTQLSNSYNQFVDNTPIQSKPTKHLFKPKTPVAHNLIKNYNNLAEEPPAKRIRNDECELKTDEVNLNNDMSIIQNIFEGINEEDIFNEFC